MPEPNPLPWYVVQTRARRELLVASLLDREEMSIYLPEVVQQGAQGTRLSPLFPGYLFVQVDLASSAAGALLHTPGVIRLVGAEQQPIPVADEVVRSLQARVAALNARGGLPAHDLRPGDPVRFKAGPLQGLDAVFVGPLTPRQRVDVLLYFLGQLQQVEVDVSLLEKTNAPVHPPAGQRPRRTRGHGRPIRALNL